MGHVTSKLMKRLPDFATFKIMLILHKLGRYSRKSYSQEGEDIVLERVFGAKKTTGFYVDVGAHHPSKYSNSFYFYKKGWRGINIDAMPGCMRLFKEVRPRDINLEVAVSDKNEVIQFYIFDESLLNSADKTLSQSRERLFGKAKTCSVRAQPLSSILEQNMPKDVEIDFISIDVEGLDLTVLKSNDWFKFRPKYILVEILGQSIQSLKDTDVCKFLTDLGYEPLAKLVHTVIFKDKNLGGLAYI